MIGAGRRDLLAGKRVQQTGDETTDQVQRELVAGGETLDHVLIVDPLIGGQRWRGSRLRRLVGVARPLDLGDLGDERGDRLIPVVELHHDQVLVAGGRGGGLEHLGVEGRQDHHRDVEVLEVVAGLGCHPDADARAGRAAVGGMAERHDDVEVGHRRPVVDGDRGGAEQIEQKGRTAHSGLGKESVRLVQRHPSTSDW